MRRWLTAGIGLVLVIGFAVSHMMRISTTNPDSPSPARAHEATLDAELARRATRFIDLLDAQRYDEALTMTTPEMVEALGGGKLGGIWQALPNQLGPRESRGAPRGVQIGGHDAVVERLQFKDVTLEARVVFDQDKRIAGFHLVPAADAPAAID